MENQAFQLTLSDSRFPLFYYSSDSRKLSRWGMIVTTLISNILLPGLVLSYGIIGCIRREAGHPTWQILITPFAFYATWKISGPWFENAAEYSTKVDSKIISLFGITLTSLGVFCNVWVENIILHGFLYGILGGIGISLILSQINYLNDDTFSTNTNKMKLLSLYGQALGQSTLPYVYMVIFYLYGHSMGYLLMTGLVLQILPLIMFFGTNGKCNRKTLRSKARSSRYQRAYSLFDDSSSLTSDTDVPLDDLTKKYWRSPSDENLFSINNVDETRFMDDKDSSNARSMYGHNDGDKLKTYYGVEILPQILEENEDIEDKQSKRGSKYVENTISIGNNKFDDIIAMNNENNNNDLAAVELNKSINDIISPTHETNEFTDKFCDILFEHKTFNRNRMICCFGISFPNNDYCQEYIRETFLHPLKLSLKTWQFYPALLLETSSSCLYVCVSSLIALRGFSVETKLNLSNIACVISIHGISWLSFLILSPWIYNLKKSKFKILSAFGSIVSSIGLLVILEFDLMDLIALGAMLTGIGCGALSTSCHETATDFIGLRKWSKIKGTLESLSGIVVAGIGVWMTHLLLFNNGVDRCIKILCIMLFLTSVFWVIVIFVESLKKNKHNYHVWPHT